MQAEKHHISLARDHSQVTRSRNGSHAAVATGAADSNGSVTQLACLYITKHVLLVEPVYRVLQGANVQYVLLP